ncbi:MAG: hypothetical protein K6T83_22105 [Alicyclobacillus sp.]|nr:hypothetical protein [Alicyclobacillus sp.]
MIRDLDVGDFVYITENRKIETYMVIAEPTKRLQRYKLQCIDPHNRREIQLPLDPDEPLWQYVFLDLTEALLDVDRQQQEIEAEIQRRVQEWADSNIGTPDRLIKCLYRSWSSLNYSSVSVDFGYFDERDVSRTANVRREIVIKRIRDLLGVDVESDD